MPKKPLRKQDYDNRLWFTILDFNMRIEEQLTMKANILFGASTLILFFALNKIVGESLMSIALIQSLHIIIFGSFISMITALMVVMPRFWFTERKDRIKEDVFYYQNIKKHYTRREYLEYIKDLPYDRKRQALAFGNQIYTLTTLLLPYKFRLIKISGITLVLTIIISAAKFFMGIIF